MTLVEFGSLLSTLAEPVAYGYFRGPMELPAIVYLETSGSDVRADNHNYARVRDVQVELYTANKDPALESSLEDLFDAQAMPYRKFCAWIPEERVFQAVYEVQLMEE